MDVDFSLQRTKMVDGQVRTTDVTDTAVLDALLSVPREAFVPRKKQSLAYIDEDLEVAPAADGVPARYLMEPSPFAKLLQLAAIRTTDFVLDIGCATGYSSAVMSRLASSVVALECDSDLVSSASDTLMKLGCDNVVVVEGPLEAGLPAEAPFDVIFIGGSVEQVPETLFEQLRDGGRLVAVLGQGNAGVARLYVKTGDVVSGSRGFNAAVRPLPGFAKVPEFQF